MENQAKVSSYKVPYEDYRKWQAVCPENEYRVVTASELPTGTPAALKQKSVRVVVMSSGDNANNRSVVVANFIRHDRHGMALDQEPLILVFDHEKQTTTGAFIHHGNWDGRTVKLNSTVVLALENSGLTAHFPTVGIPGQPAGSLTELKAHPQGHAFWNSVVAFGYPQRSG